MPEGCPRRHSGKTQPRDCNCDHTTQQTCTTPSANGQHIRGTVVWGWGKHGATGLTAMLMCQIPLTTRSKPTLVLHTTALRNMQHVFATCLNYATPATVYDFVCAANAESHKFLMLPHAHTQSYCYNVWPTLQSVKTHVACSNKPHYQPIAVANVIMLCIAGMNLHGVCVCVCVPVHALPHVCVVFLFVFSRGDLHLQAKPPKRGKATKCHNLGVIRPHSQTPVYIPLFPWC